MDYLFERRRFARMSLDEPVVCELQGRTVSARARSISGEGMLLETDFPVQEGDILEVRIEPPLTPNRPFRAELMVSRVEEITSDAGVSYRFGGRFTKVLTPVGE